MSLALWGLGACQSVSPLVKKEADEKAAQALYDQGLDRLKVGKKSEAYALFEKIPSGSRLFYPALLELQRIHYASEAWDRFFAYALFYRFQLLKARDRDLGQQKQEEEAKKEADRGLPETALLLSDNSAEKTVGKPVSLATSGERLPAWKEQFLSPFFSLEVLSLTRYCLWEEAARVLTQGQDLASEIGQEAEMEPAEHVLHLATLAMRVPQMPQLLRNPKKRTVPTTVAAERRFWRIHTQTLEEVTHPKHLRVEVQKRCDLLKGL